MLTTHSYICHSILAIRALQSTGYKIVVLISRSWMLENFLKRYADKTELILRGNSKRVAKAQHFEPTVGDSVVRHSAYTRNLGVIF